MGLERPIYSIWVQEDKTDEGLFDFNIWVWDEVENERVDELEISGFETEEAALIELEQLVKQHPEIHFIAHPSEQLVLYYF